MPLRTDQTIPIEPPITPAAPQTTGLVELSVSGPVLLEVPYIRQEQVQWCWAACALMVARFLGRAGSSQCELADFLHGQTACCTHSSSSECNRPSPYLGIGKVFTHLQVHSISHTWAVNLQVVLRELRENRPVEIGLLWSGGGGHVALIYGVTANGLFAVHDPWFGTGLFRSEALYSAYQRGRWAYSFGDFRGL